MKKISLSEFRDYCNTTYFRKIIFSTDNQTWYTTDSSMSIGAEFNKMTITLNPNSIYLSDRKSHIHIKKIKNVKLCGNCMLGDVFVVVCGDYQNDAKDVEYTLVAS